MKARISDLRREIAILHDQARERSEQISGLRASLDKRLEQVVQITRDRDEALSEARLCAIGELLTSLGVPEGPSLLARVAILAVKGVR